MRRYHYVLGRWEDVWVVSVCRVCGCGSVAFEGGGVDGLGAGLSGVRRSEWWVGRSVYGYVGAACCVSLR